MKNIDLLKISKPGDNPVRYMVKAEGVPVGFLDKYRNTRSETHPWKAFAAKETSPGSWMYAADDFFATFYGPDGKDQAISALVERSR